MLKRLTIAALLVLPMAAASLVPVVCAQQAAGEVRVLESTPAAFFVRFDRPVDHRKSTLVDWGERHTR
jgi:hypothetical protein